MGDIGEGWVYAKAADGDIPAENLMQYGEQYKYNKSHID